MRNISDDFAKLGTVFCVDTETALAPKCFEGREQVRLFQAYSPTHEFYYDLLTFDDADWGELRANLEAPGLTIVMQNAARLTYGCFRAATLILVVPKSRTQCCKAGC